MMNEKYLELVQQFVHHWKLNRRTATLLSTALLAVARHQDHLNTAKTLGILMAYQAAGTKEENQYQEGHDLVSKVSESSTEAEALDIIFNYFAECI